MKKYFFVTVLSLLFTLPFFSQENILKVGFVASGGINTGFHYERSIAENFSIVGQIGYARIFRDWGKEESTGFGLYMEGRYYFSKNKDLLEGWHAGIYTTYLNTNYRDDLFSFDRNTMSIGLVGGYQLIHTSHVTFDTLLGGGYLKFDDSGDSGDSGLYPLIGLNIGYNF